MTATLRNYTLFLCHIALAAAAFAQAGATGVPFLIISPSTESNGMGGLSISATPVNSSALSFNPAQAGMLSRTHRFSTDFYTSRTDWLPVSNLPETWLNHFSAMYGAELTDLFPFDAYGGIGYSRTYLNLGEFLRTSENDPTEIGRFRAYETSDNFTAGISTDLGVILAFGTTLKYIHSELTPFGTMQEKGAGVANIFAFDIGIISKFPLAQWVIPSRSLSLFTPRFDLSLAYAIDNLGGSVVYSDPGQSDPLPRMARIGWSVEAGIDADIFHTTISVLQATIGREVEDVLVNRTVDGSSWNYGGPFGDIDPYRGLILSEQHSNADVRRGFSFAFFDTFVYREGSFDGIGDLVYSTKGTTFSTRGIFRIAGAAMSADNDSSAIQYIFHHLEIRISESEYGNNANLSGTRFNSVVLSFYR